MTEQNHKTEDLVRDGLRSLFDAKSDDAALSAPDLLPIFSGLKPEPPHYTDKTLVARGGMKSIFKVHDPKTARYVAMATLNANSPEELYEPFLREARLTALLDHPNIITIHDIGLATNSTPYFTMELKTGQSLNQIIEEKFSRLNKALPPETTNQFVNIFLKICDAIDYAHSRNVLHLDLKPDNIQIGQHGEVVVCDWGLGKLIGDAEYDGGEFDRLLLNPDLLNNMTLSGHIKGTPGYMAPVQVEARGEKTCQTDIYALGAILYNMLTNHTPVDGKTADEMLENTAKGNIISPNERYPNRNIPPALAAVAMKALSTDPARRYRSVRELRDDLTSYLNGFSTAAENASLMQEIRLFYKRQKKVVNLSGLFLLALATAITIAFISIHKSEQTARSTLAELQKKQKELEKRGRQAAPAILDKALNELAAGNLEEALRLTKMASVQAPKNSSASNLLGLLYFFNGQYAEADESLRAKLTPQYRLIKKLNEAYLNNALTPEQEYDHVEELLRIYSQSVLTPITTSVLLHWTVDERPEFRALALRYLRLPKETLTGAINFAVAYGDPDAVDAITLHVLHELEASPDWIGRRLPATLGMKLTRDPAAKSRFKALIPANLALGQPIVRKGMEYLHNPDLVVDGNIAPESFWSAASRPATITIDLGKVHEVTQVKLFVDRLDRAKPSYAMSHSEDGIEFNPLPMKFRQTIEDRICYAYELQPTPIRYVRLKLLHLIDGPPVQIREIEVY